MQVALGWADLADAKSAADLAPVHPGIEYRVALPVAALFTWHGTNLEGVAPNIDEPISTDALWTTGTHALVSSDVRLLCCSREQLQNLGPLHSLSPGTRCGPRLRVRFDWVRTTREQQIHHVGATPSACPSERRTLEQRVANVQTCAGIEQDGGELNTHTVIARGDLMQHGLAVVCRAVVRSAAGQDQREALAAFGLLLSAVVFISGQRSPEHPEPARVIRRPVDMLERHADDLGGKSAPAAP